MDTGNHTNHQHPLNMTEEEFDKFRELVYKRTHICCADSQKTLFERKIRSRIAALHVSSFQDYYTIITKVSSEGEQEFTRLIDVIAVHETSFFRIPGHFTGLETQIFPELLQKQPRNNGRNIRIWSAGCSTGEEPYSIAISFLEVSPLRRPRASTSRRMEILATDISLSVIGKAQAGIYSPEKVEKIRKPLLDKYFENHHHQYYITQQVKNLVKFHVFNLINLETPPAPEFDIIFCRNLLIYFDRAAQERLIMGLISLLSEGGYLFLGDAESIHTFPESAKKFDFVDLGDAIIYKKRGVHA